MRTLSAWACSWSTPRTSSASPGTRLKRSTTSPSPPRGPRADARRQILASASYDDTIKLYVDDPADDWFCFATLTGHSSTVWSLAWAPRGSYLASASDDKTVRIWKRVAEHQWVEAAVIGGHGRSVYSVTWGPGKSDDPHSLGWLASAGGDGVIRVFDIIVRTPQLLSRSLFLEHLT